MNHTLLKKKFKKNQTLPLSSLCMLSTQNILYKKNPTAVDIGLIH